MRWPQSFDLGVTRSEHATREGGYYAFWNAWEVLRRGMSANLRRKPARRVLSYAGLQASEHWREYDRSYILGMVDRGVFQYFFDDEQGNADVYCGVVPHWLELVLGERYDAVKQALWRTGYIINTPRPDPKAIANTEVTSPFVEVEKFVAEVRPAHEGDGWRLAVDLSAPPASKLSDDDKARLDRVYAGKRCMCDYCLKLRG